ncbi:MAG: GntR family transcriptional regulator [Cognatishimia sp.]
MGQSSRQPKYRIVEDHLREQIKSGEYQVGSILPTEAALRTQFGVSRATVRNALAKIQADGYITRSPAIGSRVISAVPEQKFSAGWGSFDDLLLYAKDARLHIQSVEKVIVNSILSQEIGFSVGRSLVHVKAVRQNAESAPPSCLLDIYFDALYIGILDRVAGSEKPIAALIEEHFRIRINSINQEVYADILSNDVANQLSAQPGSASLVINRNYRDAEGKVFEVSRAVYSAERLHFSMTLDRSGL